MSNSLEDYMKTDPGIDFENYDLQEEIDKYKGDHPVYWQIVIRVYVPKKVKQIGSVYLPDELVQKMEQNAKFNYTGLVIKMAPGVYKDSRYELSGPLCKVGDWVMFPRGSCGNSYAYNGMTTITINEDYVLKVVDDPRSITSLATNIF